MTMRLTILAHSAAVAELVHHFPESPTAHYQEAYQKVRTELLSADKVPFLGLLQVLEADQFVHSGRGKLLRPGGVKFLAWDGRLSSPGTPSVATKTSTSWFQACSPWVHVLSRRSDGTG